MILLPSNAGWSAMHLFFFGGTVEIALRNGSQISQSR
jgi:hypothetical protein